MESLGSTCINFLSKGAQVSRLYSLGEVVWDRSQETPYTRLSYIESTGSQYINLGYIPNDKSGVTEIIAASTIITSTRGLWGFVNQSDTTYRTSIGFTTSKWFAGVTENNVLDREVIAGEMVSIRFDRQEASFSVAETKEVFAQKSCPIKFEAFLFARNDGQGGTYGTNFAGKIYGFREYDVDGNLVMDLIPAKFKATGENGMWDLVSETFFGNSGNGEFLTDGAVVEDTYTDLDYIHCDGLSWIDTNLPNTMDLIFEVECWFDTFIGRDGVTTGAWVIGGRVNPNYALGIWFEEGRLVAAYGGASSSVAWNDEVNRWYDMYFRRTEFLIDGQPYAVTGKALIPVEYETNVLIGKNQVNWAGTGDDPRNLRGRLRKVKITDASTGMVLRDYAPKMADKSGVSGMYDSVEKKFYTSQGPEEFTGITI